MKWNTDIPVSALVNRFLVKPVQNLLRAGLEKAVDKNLAAGEAKQVSKAAAKLARSGEHTHTRIDVEQASRRRVNLRSHEAVEEREPLTELLPLGDRLRSEGSGRSFAKTKWAGDTQPMLIPPLPKQTRGFSVTEAARVVRETAPNARAAGTTAATSHVSALAGKSSTTATRAEREIDKILGRSADNTNNMNAGGNQR